jgi:hypothetical protein
MKPYLILSSGAAKRLEWLRSRARHNGADWRAVRVAGFDGWRSYYGALTPGAQADGQSVWTTFLGAQFRGEKFASDCEQAPRDLRQCGGWFTDGADQSNTARGIVARLTHGRWIAGYTWSLNDERVYFPHVYDDERDAAIAADEEARIFAERESEYQNRRLEAERLVASIRKDRESVETDFAEFAEFLED